MNFALPIASFILSLALHAAALRMFPTLGLLDFPERYGLSRPRIPYPTGILAVILFLGFLPFLADLRGQTIGLLLSVVVIAIMCFIDDRLPLHPLLRLIVQILIGLILFLSTIRIYSFTNPFEGVIGGGVIPLDRLLIQSTTFGSLPILSGLFTIGWVFLTINALNWFDGIPGQVSVLTTIGFVVIGFLALSPRVDQADIARISFVLAGIAAGGMFFDFPPAKVLMGDTGAMFFGLMIGVLTIYAGGKVATAFLVLGVPLIDFFFVMIRRIARGQSPLKGNANDQHLHHRLLAKGWSPRQIIILTAALGSAFGITALFLNTFGKFVAAGILFLIMVGLSIYSKPTQPS